MPMSIFLFFKLSSKQKTGEGDNQSLMLLQNQIENLTKTLDSRLNETNKQSKTKWIP